jgi:hypothetical protein
MTGREIFAKKSIKIIYELNNPPSANVISQQKGMSSMPFLSRNTVLSSSYLPALLIAGDTSFLAGLAFGMSLGLLALFLAILAYIHPSPLWLVAANVWSLRRPVAAARCRWQRLGLEELAQAASSVFASLLASFVIVGQRKRGLGYPSPRC